MGTNGYEFEPRHYTYTSNPAGIDLQLHSLRELAHAIVDFWEGYEDLFAEGSMRFREMSPTSLRFAADVAELSDAMDWFDAPEGADNWTTWLYLTNLSVQSQETAEFEFHLMRSSNAARVLLWEAYFQDEDLG